MMYPITKREEDESKGLISFRPDWFGKEADKSIVGPKKETWEEAYLRSLQAEAESLDGALIFTESIQILLPFPFFLIFCSWILL